MFFSKLIEFSSDFSQTNPALNQIQCPIPWVTFIFLRLNDHLSTLKSLDVLLLTSLPLKHTCNTNNCYLNGYQSINNSLHQYKQLVKFERIYRHAILYAVAFKYAGAIYLRVIYMTANANTKCEMKRRP